LAELEIHPLVAFAEAQSPRWNYATAADFFEIPISTFKQMVRGFTGCSFTRADDCEKRSKGRVTALSIMRWHERNKREPGEATAA